MRVIHMEQVFFTLKVASFAMLMGALPRLLNPAGWSPVSRQLAITVGIGLLTATIVHLWKVFVLNRFFPDREAAKLSLWQRIKNRRKLKKNPLGLDE